MTTMTGMAKFKIGRIQLLTLKPELNQTAISESRCQRVSVMSTLKKMVSDKIMGRNLTRLKPNKVLIASFGIQPFAALRTK